MNLVIVQYNAGNVQSVIHALHRLEVEPRLSDDPEVLRSADKVIFPGVGEASTTMDYLRARGLDRLIASLRQPVLGICLGMQLMCAHSEEGDTDCLGIFDRQVRRFPSGGAKVPHMGWNTLGDLRSPLLAGLPEPAYVYFVHSYYVEPGPDSIATTDYILPFCAALHRDNFYATQFHPEKSGETGAQILRNFLERV
ncbi:MAG: imidazole glycerol phosphate synthase subunit HisH [Bacteroidia bacterium]